MHALRKLIRGCPAPYEQVEAGHFAQERCEDKSAARPARIRLMGAGNFV